MNYKYIIVFFCFSLGIISHLKSQNFLSTNGKAIVNETGDTILLRGMGLGGWMLQEGYMLQTSGFASAQFQIRGKIEELIGEEDTDLFYETWLANHVRKIDIDSLKAWGFNSVRLPMHYNLYTLPIEDEPVAGENTWLTKGFEMTDSLISWCAQNEMYVILDLHAAPGGQGYDQAISDYDTSKPSLWESQANKNKTVALWKKLAERYVDEPWVGGYDLLNETNWDLPGGSALRALYGDITDSIRSVDNNHIIFIEGNWFANDFTGLTPPWDDNFVYAPHKYWSYNNIESIQWVLNLRDQYNVPLYLGESGENSNTWFRDAIALLEGEGIGWAWWPMKKVESISGLLSVVKTPEYQTLLNYWNNGGNPPNAAFAKATLLELADNLKLENCIYQKGVVDAMIRQVYSDEAIPVETQEIPGVVFATEYDMGKQGSAYFDTDVANYHVSTGNYTAWNNGWTYRNDGVDIEPCSDNTNTNGYNVGWLEPGEWMQYDVDIAEAGVYDINLRTASGGFDGSFHFSVDGSDISSTRWVPHTGGYQNWETIVVPNVVLTPENKKLRFHSDGSSYNLSSFEFVLQGPTTDVESKFVSALTLSQSLIQVNLNKPMAGPLPASPADFEVFVNGSPISITDATLNTDNPRIITIAVDFLIQSSHFVKISYSGQEIIAQDGSVLNTFYLEDVQNNTPVFHSVPGRIEAEDFFFQSGVELENSEDVGGGENIGYLDVGDYLDYYINVAETGTYSVEYRTASQGSTGGVQLQVINPNGGNFILQNATFSSTGGWQSWATTTGSSVVLNGGQRQLRVLITQPSFNLNWIEFSLITPTYEPSSTIHLSVYPNPGGGEFYLQGVLPNVQDVTIEVYNLLGQPVLQKVVKGITNLNETLDLYALPDGNYFVSVLLPDGKRYREKIVKVAE
jgi:aryl-phospho-beta-D-glucosidase BglC (GH1 family)